MTPVLRSVEADDLLPLAQVWHQGWIEAHADHTPQALHALRTAQSFVERLTRHAPLCRTAGPIGAPLGLCLVKGDEVDQLYVAPASRGTGLAAALLADAEASIRSAGHTTARLFAIRQNLRALAFYTRQGWENQGEQVAHVETLDEPFPLRCCLLTKQL